MFQLNEYIERLPNELDLDVMRKFLLKVKQLRRPLKSLVIVLEENSMQGLEARCEKGDTRCFAILLAQLYICQFSWADRQARKP